MSKFEIHYCKIKKPDLKHLEIKYDEVVKQNSLSSSSIDESESESDEKYNPFHLEKMQCFNPIYKTFFEMNSNNYDSIGLNHKYHLYDLNEVVNKESGEVLQKNIFIKFAPLLDTVRYLIGKYKNEDSLKVLPSYSNETHEKLSNPNNSSYVDNFFCYLSSQMLNTHQFPHAIDYYGSFLGIQKKYRLNIADDIEYLLESEYFNNNKGKIYELEQSNDPYANFGSRCNKNKLLIHNESNITTISLEELIDESVQTTEIEDSLLDNPTENCIYEKDNESNSDTSSVGTSNNSETNYSDDDSDAATEWEDESGGEDVSDDDEEAEDAEQEGSDESDENSEDEDEEIQMNAFIYDFPIQMICLEKCKGTFDSLLVKHKLDVQQVASALFQVIMTLLAYQKSFYFTHNDLHTNNIMYVETDQEYITYKYLNEYYKVPTYGKIFKIIDYGRAIYRFQGKTFCSDSFAPGGDAYTQYNFEPFFNEKKPRLNPNYSFDLCRLGCSIYDFILEEDDTDEEPNELDDFQKIVMKWVKDDNGKNILYKKNGEERYPNFKLYKMIARTVHHCTPESQLKEPFFAQFKTESLTDNISCVIDIDGLPCYA